MDKPVYVRYRVPKPVLLWETYKDPTVQEHWSGVSMVYDRDGDIVTVRDQNNRPFELDTNEYRVITEQEYFLEMLRS